MNVFSLFSNDEIKEVCIENQSVESEQWISEDTKIVEVKLSVKLKYSSSSELKPRETVKEYLLNWLYNVIQNELKPGSFDRKEQSAKYQVIPYLGDIPLDDLSADEIQNMINKLKTNYSYSTIKKAYECINGCLKYAVIRQRLKYNPAISVTLPKNEKKAKSDIHYFSHAEALAICNEAVSCHTNGNRKYRLGELIIFLLNTGLRIGEALALRWSDVDFDRRHIKIRRNVVYAQVRNGDDDKHYALIEQSKPKTNSGSRIVPLNCKAMTAILSLKAINGQYEFVFATSTGKRTYPRNVDRMLRSICRTLYIKPQGAHALRHTFASLLFQKGADVKTVSELLGHADTSITYDTYIHLIQEQKVIAVEQLDRII